MMPDASRRIGIDLGGTKIAGVGLAAEGRFTEIKRSLTPRDDYHGTLKAIIELITAIEVELGGEAQIGVGMPGSIAAKSGRVQNANSTWLNGKPFAIDLAQAMPRKLRFANDANCFALSEAVDGAGEGAQSVFGIIIGTGCGGGLVLDGQIIEGPHRIGGEWGHNPLPWAAPDEVPGPQCWCGRMGCMETWVSGPGLEADHVRHGGADLSDTQLSVTQLSVAEIAELASAGDATARATLERHADRLARGIVMVINIFDPDRIVLGGGLSNLGHLYTDLPPLITPHIFADEKSVDIRPPKHGAMSGVRGAARLWNVEGS